MERRSTALEGEQGGEAAGTRKRLRVRFNEIDAAGIVFYPRFFDYFHMTFEDFFLPATGTPYHEWIGERQIGFPAVHIETDFRAPLRYGMELEIALSFPRIGNSSFVCRYEVTDPATNTLICTSEVTVVTSDVKKMTPMPIPPQLRQALERSPGR